MSLKRGSLNEGIKARVNVRSRHRGNIGLNRKTMAVLVYRHIYKTFGLNCLTNDYAPLIQRIFESWSDFPLLQSDSCGHGVAELMDETNPRSGDECGVRLILAVSLLYEIPCPGAVIHHRGESHSQQNNRICKRAAVIQSSDGRSLGLHLIERWDRPWPIYYGVRVKNWAWHYSLPSSLGIWHESGDWRQGVCLWRQNE